VDGNANVTLHESLIYVTKVRFQLDRYTCLTVPVPDPQSVNICQVTARYNRAASTRRVRLSLYATPTSRSSLRRPYLTLSSKKVFRHVQPPHFISILTLSLSTCPDTAQQSSRNVDTTRHRHRVRHAGNRATPLRPSTMATRPYTNDVASSPRHATRPHTNDAASPRRDGSRSSRDTRRHYSTSTLHLLSADKIC